MKRIFTSLLLICALIAGTETLRAQTTVPSLITSNQVWDISGSPYLINQNTYIDSGVKVLVQPGVQVLGASGNIQLIVDGELQANGTWDSTILFDQLQIQLQPKAVSYNSTTGSGAYFNWCVFTSPGIGKMVFFISGISVKIENSTFVNTYYSLYIIGSTGTQRVDILGCTFNDNTGMSSPIYSGSNYLELYLIENTFNNFGGGGGVFIYGKKATILNNTFNGMNKVGISTQAALISCNLFNKLRQGVEVTVNAMDSVSDCVFTHNTLDSTGHSIGSETMLKVTKNSASQKLNQSRFNYNNFLYHIAGRKVMINGSNPSPSTFETVNLENNYWVSTDSASIDTVMIWDYADDIKMFGRADFSGFLANLDTACGDSTGSSCHASYYIAMDTTILYNMFIVNTSTGTSSNTTYTWDFGDGYSSNDENPSHTYASFGKYLLCVTLYNDAENCSSTYCDSIGIDSNGMLLKNGGFTIHVINEDDLTSIDQNDFFGDIRIYPNPTEGKLFIELNETDNNEPITIRVFDLAGKMVYETQNPGTQHVVIDLSTLQEGLYLLDLQKGQSGYTSKIVVNR